MDCSKLTTAEDMQRNRFILFIAEYFTKWTEAVPLPDQEAVTVAPALIYRHIRYLQYKKRFIQMKGLTLNPYVMKFMSY